MGTLDLFAGRVLKEVGMILAGSSKPDLTDRVRRHLERVALTKPDRCCTIDDCADLLEREHVSLGAAAGTVFKYEAWEFTGEWVPSVRKSNHARPVRRWRLK